MKLEGDNFHELDGVAQCIYVGTLVCKLVQCNIPRVVTASVL